MPPSLRIGVTPDPPPVTAERDLILQKRLADLISPPQSAVAKCGAALGARLMSSSVRFPWS